MLVRAVMMCKNEDELLGIWGAYHGDLLGYENLHVFDNGSTSPAALDALEKLDARGAVVDRTHPSPADFRAKGQIVAARIRTLDSESSGDFAFPLDCDEFLCVETAPYDLDCSTSGLEAALEGYRDFPGALAIAAGYDNHAGRPELYRRSPDQRKVFFARDACVDLDQGFHIGTAREPDRLRTTIAYVHHHFKPYEVLTEHARAKLLPWVEDLSPEALQAHRRNGVPGSHLIGHLEHDGEANYLSGFQDHLFQPLPTFTAALHRLGLDTPYARRAGGKVSPSSGAESRRADAGPSRPGGR